MNYHVYQEILEYVPILRNNLENLKENNLFKYIKSFLSEIKCNKYLISLSGGVDSMVFCIISKVLKLNNDIDFVCCHINYNNRKESIDEMNFLIDWCKHHEIELFVKDITHIHRRDGNRSDYEEETRNIRYSFYKELIEQNNCYGVVLAHHKDDYSENVFNNIMRGHNDIMNLGVFKELNILHEVRVLRPMLNFVKEDIYSIAKEYQIPYFLDTTPNWSCRGQMRNEIFPRCNKCYGNNFMGNLHSIGKQSEDINNIITRHLVNPILNSVFYGKYGFKIPKTSSLKEILILGSVLNSITFKLKIKTIKRKNVKMIIEKFNKSVELNIIKDYKCFITNESIIFIKINEITSFFKGKKYLDLYFKALNNINDINLINDFINGKIYYLINKDTNKLSLKGKKSDRLKKININELINKYIPNLYIENKKLDEEFNNYLKVDISSSIQ